MNITKVLIDAGDYDEEVFPLAKALDPEQHLEESIKIGNELLDKIPGPNEMDVHGQNIFYRRGLDRLKARATIIDSVNRAQRNNDDDDDDETYDESGVRESKTLNQLYNNKVGDESGGFTTGCMSIGVMFDKTVEELLMSMGDVQKSLNEIQRVFAIDGIEENGIGIGVDNFAETLFSEMSEVKKIQVKEAIKSELLLNELDGICGVD
uniref:Uncharacterized protein n=1 Tax=Proboscia inermis TaxID=420281 RepID=A0A7S0CC68_9STRA